MELPVIKTYSKKDPVVTFTSTAKVVPKDLRLDNNGDIRPSCLQEKTLIVDNFDDTFDRMARGVVITSPKITANQFNDTSGNEYSSEFEPSLTKKEQVEQSKKLIDNNADKGLKRKICSDEECDTNTIKNEPKKIKILSVEEPKEDFKKLFKNLKKKKNAKIESTSSVENFQDKPCDPILTKENENENCNGGSNSILKELPVKLSHSILLAPSDNLPTSTPRGDKIRKFNVKNISPISFDKENYVQKDKNGTDVPQVEFLKPQSKPLKSKAQNNIANESDLKENDEIATFDPQDSTLNKSSEITFGQGEKESAINDTEVNEINNKNTNLLTVNHKFDPSYCESPLLFEDTLNVENPSKTNLSSKSDKAARNLFKTSFNNQENENLAEINNESSYYPDDWSNDYDTSFEAFKEKDNHNAETQKSFTKNNESNIENFPPSLPEKNSSESKDPEKSNEIYYETNESIEENCTQSSEKTNTSEASEEYFETNDSQNESLAQTSVEKNGFESKKQLLETTCDLKAQDQTSNKFEKDVNSKEINLRTNDELKTSADNKLENLNEKENDKDVDSSLVTKDNAIAQNIEMNSLMESEESKIFENERNKDSVANESLNKVPVIVIPKINDIHSTLQENTENKSTVETERKNSKSDLKSVVSSFDLLHEIKSNKDNDQYLKNNLQKTRLTENITNNVIVKNSSTEEMLKKISRHNLQVRLEKLDINYVKKGSPILSKRSVRKSIKTGTQNNKIIKNNRSSTIRRSQKNKDALNLESNKKNQKKLQDTITGKGDYPAHWNYAIVLLTDEDIQNAENHLSKIKDSRNSQVLLQDFQIENGIEDEEESFFSKLRQSSKVTVRKNVFKKWERPLEAIAESDQIVDTNLVEKDIEVLRSPESSRQSKQIFLKPGKSWARSLSIINNFQNKYNLDDYSVGRSENWRQSVQNVLNMQSKDSLESNPNKGFEEFTKEDNFIMPHVPEKRSDRFSSIPNRISSLSPNRFSSLRFSMRIVPSPRNSNFSDDLLQRFSSAESTRKTSIIRKTSLKFRRDTLIQTEDDLIKSARDIVFKHCNQTSYLPFDECFPASFTKNCRKIGEGVYGEVYLYDNKTEKSVIKIIPIEGEKLVNCEPQKKFHEILSEIIIAEQLHKLRFGEEFSTDGFVGVNRIMCVQGKYPQQLIKLWNKYDKEKNSENDCPSIFEEDQLYIILDLAHGGQDLEAYTFQNASESYSIFIQTTLALAVAEEMLEFEHRDLHWGNILISKTNDKNLSYKIANDQILLQTKGVKVSVIDFTLSRMSYKGCRIFNDLAADPSLFTAQGEYQFDIYRKMRDSVDNDWQKFNPYTNVLWLDYTLDKMITAGRYKKKTTKIHKTSIEQMTQLRTEILNYKSAYDLVQNCNMIKKFYKDK